MLGFFVVTTAILLKESQINTSKGNVIDKSEFIIEAQWTDNSTDDIDLLVKNPLGEVVYYKKPSVGLMTIDRDDQGINNSAKDANGDAVFNASRREVVSIRKSIPGDYTVNILMYYRRSISGPVPVKVMVRKLNPYVEVSERTVIMDKMKGEATAVIFTINNDGEVTNKDETTKVSLIKRIEP
jgi:hypothetical protein